VKLKRLILQGFKSFKDKTVVNFDQGITGIVGPNGCGKSNIVDALFWVMGEQSAKHLRGTSMKDLIFSGSQKYSPSPWAEVSLVLENDDGKHIHIQDQVCAPSEIQLTRKLYRNGETEYRINNRPARLRDIQEVFMDTGAGAKSYSIIAQGEIDRLVRAKPVERRHMIEEVAGITKFKMRRKESLRKIEQTQANLSRLLDLEVEIEKHLKSLEKQAEKASRARVLRDKIKRHDLIVSSHREHDFLKDYAEAKKYIVENRSQVGGMTLEKEQLELSLEEERITKLELTEQVEELHRNFNEASKKLAAAEEKLKFLKRSIEDREKQIERALNDNQEIEQEREGRLERINKLKEEQLSLEQEQQEEFDFDSLEMQCESQKEELELLEEQLRSWDKEIAELRKQKQELGQEIYKNTSKQEEYARTLEDLASEIESLERVYSSVNDEMVEERKSLAEAEAKLEQSAASFKEIETGREGLKKLVQGLEVELRQVSQKSYSQAARLSSLKEVRNALEGTQVGAKEFLETEVGKESYDLLGNILKSPAEYSKGIEALWGDYFSSLVSFDKNFTGAKSWLAANPNKNLELLNIAADFDSFSEVRERLALHLGEELVHLPDVVDFTAERFLGLKKLFNGFFLAPKLDQTKIDAISSIGFRGLVSSDGKVALKKANHLHIHTFFGEREEGMGQIERNNEIEFLEQEVVRLQEEQILKEELVEEKRQELQALEEKFSLVQNEYLEAKALQATKSSSIASKENNYKSSTAKLDILKNRRTEISKSRLGLLESDEKLQQQDKVLSEKLEGVEGRKEEEGARFEDMRAQYQELRDEVNKKMVAKQTYATKVHAITSQIDDVSSQITRLENRKEQNERNLEQQKEEKLRLSEEAETLEESNFDDADHLREAESVLSEKRDELSELLTEMQERETRVKDLSSTVNKIEKQLVEREMKMNQIVVEEDALVRNQFEKYQIDLRYDLSRFLQLESNDLEGLNDISSLFVQESENGSVSVEREPYEFVRRYGQDLRDSREKYRQYKAELTRLGEINWQAIEDYDRQKMRYDFIKAQEEQLKVSLEDLERAIAHIDEKSKTRFKEAFEEVNVRFEKVFPIIFGGGSAKLEVVGDLDDAECGVEIFARPPGKKNQSITLLSGGEKALTALALIFSIFLVKPSPFCLLDEVDAPLDDANVGRFNELLREMVQDSQFVLITHNKKTMELNDSLYGVTMQEPGVSKAISVQLQ